MMLFKPEGHTTVQLIINEAMNIAKAINLCAHGQKERNTHCCTHPLVVLGVFGDHISEQAYPVIDAGAILLLNQVVHFSLVWLTDITISLIVIKAAKRRDGPGERGRLELGRGRRGGHRGKLWLS